DGDRLTATQRVFDDEKIVARHALRERVLERVADRRAAGPEERGTEQAERDDRSDTGSDDAHRGADRQPDPGAGRDTGDGADRGTGARRLAFVDRNRAQPPDIGAGGQQREAVLWDSQ